MRRLRLRLILNAAALAAASPTLLFSDWKNAARLDRNESDWLLCTPVAAKRASQWQRSGPRLPGANGAKMFVALHNVTNIFFEEARQQRSQTIRSGAIDLELSNL